MPEVEIKVDLDALTRAKDAVRTGMDRYDLIETGQAVKAGAQRIQGEWMRYISGVKVTYSGGSFTVNSVSGGYRSAVQNGLRYPMEGNFLKGGVTISLNYAETLERGFGPYDEKPGLLASPKAKMTKAEPGNPSHPYIDVPFRHNESTIPGRFKSQVKAGKTVMGTVRIKDMSGSVMVNQWTKSGTIKMSAGQSFEAPVGARTQIHTMKWKTPFMGVQLHGNPYTWGNPPRGPMTGTFTGLTRGLQEPNTYFTFRRVSQNSDRSSWIHPGIEPRPVSKAIEENLAPELEKMIETGFNMDVARRVRLEGLVRP